MGLINLPQKATLPHRNKNAITNNVELIHWSFGVILKHPFIFQRDWELEKIT